jgi:hypothetical protein
LGFRGHPRSEPSSACCISSSHSKGPEVSYEDTPTLSVYLLSGGLCGYRFYPADTLPAIVHHEVSYRAEAMQITVYELPKIPLLKRSENYRAWANRLTIKRVIAA